MRGAQSREYGLTADLVAEVVSTNEKQRFSISADGRRIRANHGHSLVVDLGLEPREPPEFLYHGTATLNLSSIRDSGILPLSRQHVHLSESEAAAKTVGTRHGRPFVFTIPSAHMHRASRGVACTHFDVSLFFERLPRRRKGACDR